MESNLLARHIYAIHDPGGEDLIIQAGRTGYVVFTEDVQNVHGRDYSGYTSRGIVPIVRLNWGYGSTGTIPDKRRYPEYAAACARFVSNSKGARLWIVGNEPNHSQEWPDGKVIMPLKYGECYTLTYRAIKAVGPEHMVGPAAIAPYDNTVKYSGNVNGDWITYFRNVLETIQALGAGIDFIPLHAYTHGSDAQLLVKSRKMDPPFENREYNFLVYREFLWVIPQVFKHVPVFITEIDQIEPWEDANTGWMSTLYNEISTWNKIPGVQQIYCVAIYRWPKDYDQWGWSHKQGVINDFRDALKKNFEAPVVVEKSPQVFKPIDEPVMPLILNDDTWNRSYPYVLNFEGGYSDDPRDKGNWTGGQVNVGKLKGTKYGISAGSYPELDIANLTEAQALEIYKRNYWDASGSENLAWPLCLVHFDTAINAGVARAMTLLLSSEKDPILYLSQRLVWYTTLDDWDVWSAGWSRRIAKLMTIIAGAKSGGN